MYVPKRWRNDQLSDLLLEVEVTGNPAYVERAPNFWIAIFGKPDKLILSSAVRQQHGLVAEPEGSIAQVDPLEVSHAYRYFR
jgi:hypothetical protein